MRGLGKIVSRLAAARRTMQAATSNDDGRLAALENFGSNPGKLDARVFVSATPPTALVVVLHGCTQSASVYDRGSGWSKLAESHGFAVLFPQQPRSNNPNLCFNWYVPGNARRGRGEPASIAQMVRHMVAEHGIAPSRVFITGLSAGGAMTSIMLACYPDLFAAGAIIAGLPFAVADTLPGALESMRGQGLPSRQVLAAKARAAGDGAAKPPPVSVWHGTRDTIVDPVNATAIVDQWRDLHGVGDAQPRTGQVNGHRRQIWSDARGRPLVERYDIEGMGHGTPIDTRDGQACGVAGPHMLDVGICSTREMANAWGLISAADRQASEHPPAWEHESRPRPHAAASTHPKDVGAVIEDALRTAGLMR